MRLSPQSLNLESIPVVLPHRNINVGVGKAVETENQKLGSPSKAVPSKTILDDVRKKPLRLQQQRSSQGSDQSGDVGASGMRVSLSNQNSINDGDDVFHRQQSVDKKDRRLRVPQESQLRSRSISRDSSLNADNILQDMDNPLSLDGKENEPVEAQLRTTLNDSSEFSGVNSLDNKPEVLAVKVAEKEDEAIGGFIPNEPEVKAIPAVPEGKPDLNEGNVSSSQVFSFDEDGDEYFDASDSYDESENPPIKPMISDSGSGRSIRSEYPEAGEGVDREPSDAGKVSDDEDDDEYFDAPETFDESE